MPQTKPETSDSIAAMFFPVASLSNPPKVIMGDKQAKYKKMKDATHWSARASLKSDK